MNTTLNLPLTLPDPSPLHYDIFAETSNGSPDLVIQLKDNTRTIHQLGVPFILLEIFYLLPEASPTDRFNLRPFFDEDTPRILTYKEALDLKEETNDSITDSINRTVSIYTTLHGIA